MFELLLHYSKKKQFFPNSGPGPKTLLAGDTELGYFGQVGTDAVFTAAEMASALGISQGTVNNASMVWLKFYYKGRVLFVAQKGIVDAVSWNHLYDCGVIYGVDGGGSNSPRSYAVDQMTILEKGSDKFIVRTMKGYNADPFVYSSGGLNAVEADGSEWNDLLYRVSATVTAPPLDKFEQFTNQELDFSNKQTWVQETPTAASTARGMRGYNDVRYTSYAGGSSNNATRTWRPVLVYVGPDDLLKPKIAAASTDFLMPPGKLTASLEGESYVLPVISMHYTATFMKQPAGESGKVSGSPLLAVGGFTYTVNTEV